MDTIFEQDKHMLTFMEGVEKGELDFFLGIDNPTRVYKAKFEKNEDFAVEYGCVEVYTNHQRKRVARGQGDL